MPAVPGGAAGGGGVCRPRAAWILLGVQLYVAVTERRMTMSATLWNRFWCLVLGHSDFTLGKITRCVNCYRVKG
jgi:hypothetical protein